ncbi:unnamed protein product [Chondrus crispus]|uniref:Uncharacterized protein n=1 Tax=Chondrus crispus TaxID=2769 RepID=R7QAG9_CHOCR|nr:unnamed protein product [Chondrus crispus]CDF35487.1 unnamed protein product [Chondrus crispus]|eukprot:XP_005715306.1 unnamed protein product [Chondrus crispus]
MTCPSDSAKSSVDAAQRRRRQFWIAQGAETARLRTLSLDAFLAWMEETRRSGSSSWLRGLLLVMKAQWKCVEATMPGVSLFLRKVFLNYAERPRDFAGEITILHDGMRRAISLRPAVNQVQVGGMLSLWMPIRQGGRI